MQRFLGSMEKMTKILTWLTFKTWLKKMCALCKKYWQILVGISIPIILMIVFKKDGNIRKILDRAKDDYEKEIGVINRSHSQEIEDRESARKRYEDSMKEIEKKYIESKIELDNKKKKEIEKILLESDGDPAEITRRIAELTGFEIHIS